MTSIRPFKVVVTLPNGEEEIFHNVVAVEVEKKCVWERCGKIFTTRRNKIYCSPKCAKDKANQQYKLSKYFDPSKSSRQPPPKKKNGKRYGNGCWRSRVLKRDGHKCVLCGSTERLEADHIKPYALFPELRNKTENGRTLCNSCHRKTTTYGGRVFWIASVEVE